MALASSGCVSMARVSNLGDATCASAFERAIADALAAQQEAPSEGERLARRARHALARHDAGPRPFVIAAPSGTDYHFLVDTRRSGCHLRLYGRVHARAAWTNTLTWIETRELPGCTCTR